MLDNDLENRLIHRDMIIALPDQICSCPVFVYLGTGNTI